MASISILWLEDSSWLRRAAAQSYALPLPNLVCNPNHLQVVLRVESGARDKNPFVCIYNPAATFHTATFSSANGDGDLLTSISSHCNCRTSSLESRSFCCGLVWVKTISSNWANLTSSNSEVGSQILRLLTDIVCTHQWDSVIVIISWPLRNQATKLFALVKGGNLI